MSEERRMYRMTEGQRRHYLVLLFAGRVRQAIDFRDECGTRQWLECPQYMGRNPMGMYEGTNRPLHLQRRYLQSLSHCQE